MCGIAGIWNRDGRPVSRSEIQRMNDLQAHRGPDGEGIWMRPGLGLGHRRLAIIDPTAAGQQPMGTSDGELWITFNGEIHNYEELRAELICGGIRFRGGSDTELLLEAYRNWGIDCFARLNGMWAVALWDQKRQELVLCRDRFGIKPLYVSVRGSRLAFASEIKAILAACPEERRINEAELYSFLAGGSPDAGPSTFFAGVTALPPATCRVLRRDGGSEDRCYWRLPAGGEEPRPDAADELRHLLDDSVRLRLRSDVPVGACLSGGLDSSSVVRIASQHVDELHCFSMRTRGSVLDESGFAEIAVRGLEAPRLHWVDPDPDRMLDIMSHIVWHHDAPTPSRGRYPHWFTLREAGRHVKVVLDGQAADELLAGYGRFRLPHLIDHWNASRRRSLLQAIGEAPALVRALVGPCRGSAVAALARTRAWPVWPAPRILARDFARRQGALDASLFYDSWLAPGVGPPSSGHLDSALRGEFQRVGLPELLHAEDALAMAFSVEARPAFLDHRLVEFCFRLPGDEKIRDGWSKSVLRRSMEGVLPPEIQWRRDKTGFQVPLCDWLRVDANARRVEDLLLSPDARSREFLDPGALKGFVRRWRRDPRRIAAYGRELLWRCLTVELWLRLFCGDSVEPLPAVGGL